MSCPKAAPKDPVPSIIPTTVPIDFSLELSCFNFPYFFINNHYNITRSAQEIPDIIATAPPINSPKIKMKIKKRTVYSGLITIRNSCMTVASRILNTASGVLLL